MNDDVIGSLWQEAGAKANPSASSTSYAPRPQGQSGSFVHLALNDLAATIAEDKKLLSAATDPKEQKRLSDNIANAEKELVNWANRGYQPQGGFIPVTSQQTQSSRSEFPDSIGLNIIDSLKQEAEGKPQSQGLRQTTPTIPQASYSNEERRFAQAPNAPAIVNPAMARQAAKRRPYEAGPIQGAGEAARALIQNTVTLPAALATGLAGDIYGKLTGNPPAPGTSFADRMREVLGYTPQSEAGRNALAAIAGIEGKITGSSMPLFAGMTGTGPAAVLAGPAITQVSPRVLEAAGVVSRIPVEAAGIAINQLGRFPAAVRAEMQAVKPVIAPARAAVESAGRVASGEPQMIGVGAASTRNAALALANPTEVRGAGYPQYKLSQSSMPVNAGEQAKNRAIVAEILGPETEGIRPSVASRDPLALRQDYTESRMNPPTPRGQVIASQIAAEQRALDNYAKSIVDRTGANPFLTDDYARGQMINDALYGDNGMRGALAAAKRDLYAEAYRIGGNEPVSTAGLDALLKNPHFASHLRMAGNKDFIPGLSDLLLEHLKNGVGFVDDAGKIPAKPGSLASLENLRKDINANAWTPDNAKFIRKVMEAIDKDADSVKGNAAYAQARSLHRAEKSLFESKGLGTVFGEMDANGVPKGAAIEKIPAMMNRLPTDQWKHVYDTLDQLSKGRIRGYEHALPIPAETRRAAAAAIAEIKGSLAREVYSAGAKNIGNWNANEANKAMNALDRKIRYAFDPEEQRRFAVLNAGGYLMPGAHPYEGAALQQLQVNKSMQEAGVKAATVLGSVATHGSAIGAKGAEVAARKGFKFLEERAANKAAQEHRNQSRINQEEGRKALRSMGWQQ